MATLKLNYAIEKRLEAPITHTTIPKLDLQVAVYGVRLRRQLLREYDVRIEKVYHWTDSSTVWQWLQSAHKKQQVFVANRAAEILENSSMDQWRHVKGIKKPSDIGTRGTILVRRKSQGVRMVKRARMAPERWTKKAKAAVPSERSWSWASNQYCNQPQKLI